MSYRNTNHLPLGYSTLPYPWQMDDPGKILKASDWKKWKKYQEDKKNFVPTIYSGSTNIGEIFLQPGITVHESGY